MPAPVPFLTPYVPELGETVLARRRLTETFRRAVITGVYRIAPLDGPRATYTVVWLESDRSPKMPIIAGCTNRITYTHGPPLFRRIKDGVECPTCGTWWAGTAPGADLEPEDVVWHGKPPGEAPGG